MMLRTFGGSGGRIACWGCGLRVWGWRRSFCAFCSALLWLWFGLVLRVGTGSYCKQGWRML
jgi:hypothetical protein